MPSALSVRLGLDSLVAPLMTLVAAPLMTLLAAGLGGCDAEVCDADALQRVLDDAVPGIIVEARACRYDGAFEVPSGVTLRGQGTDRTVLSSEEGVAVRLGRGAALEALEVRVERGRGVEVTDTAALRDVVIRGPVDRAAADALPPTPSPTSTATHGIVLVSAGTPEAPVELRRVDVRGFARFGMLAIDSQLLWEGGASAENLGTGLMVRGGAAVLRDVEIARTWRGLSLYGYGAVFTQGAEIVTDGLVLRDNESAGALHDGASAAHEALLAEGNASGGVWVQRASSFVLSGAELSDNALAGLVLVETPSAAVRDTRIATTRAAVAILPDLGEVQIGDGLQAVLADATELRLERVTLTGNARVGLLLDVATVAIPPEALRDVVVEADGDSLGAVAQGAAGPIDPDTWSGGLERRGAAAVNDVGVDRLSVLGAVAPMFLPPAEP